MKYQVFKFLVVGGSSALLDILLTIFFKEKIGLSPIFSVVVGQIFVIFYNFSLNKFWSFNSKTLLFSQMVRFSMLLVFNYLFGILLMYLLNGLAQIDYRIVRLGSIALMAIYNFFVYKYWVYRE